MNNACTTALAGAVTILVLLSASDVGSVSGTDPKTANGEYLTGGPGDLTDGVIVYQNPFWNVENHDGTGPYVGFGSADPTTKFPSNDDTFISSITLYLVEKNGAGGMAIVILAMLFTGLVVAGSVTVAMGGRFARKLRRSWQGDRSHSARRRRTY